MERLRASSRIYYAKGTIKQTLCLIAVALFCDQRQKSLALTDRQCRISLLNPEKSCTTGLRRNDHAALHVGMILAKIIDGSRLFHQ
jgi:hypothetical protein